MQILEIIAGLFLLLLSFVSFKWSREYKRDAEHWSDIKGSDIGTHSRVGYTITFVLGIVLAFAGIVLLSSS